MAWQQEVFDKVCGTARLEPDLGFTELDWDPCVCIEMNPAAMRWLDSFHAGNEKRRKA